MIDWKQIIIGGIIGMAILDISVYALTQQTNLPSNVTIWGINSYNTPNGPFIPQSTGFFGTPLFSYNQYGSGTEIVSTLTPNYVYFSMLGFLIGIVTVAIATSTDI